MGSLWQDLRYGARSLARTPGFTVVALVTLALGIGASTAVVGLVDALFFRQPPVRHPASLVLVSETRAGETGSFPLAYADYLDYRAGARALADLAAEYPSAPLSFVAPDTSAEINGSVVTANYFPLLGLTPARGRFFRPDEDEVPDRDPVAVVSDAFWRGTLGGDPEVLASIHEGPGFDPARLVLLRLRPGLVNDSPARAAAFLREAVPRVEAVPGVVAASPAAFPPFWRNRMPVWLPGAAPSRPDAALSAAYNVVGPRYFETLGVPLAGGRGFDSGDGPETPRAAIVNETLARRLWPDGDPVGRSLVVDGRPCAVIGVARNAQYRSVGEPPTPFVYLDFWQQEDLAREPAEARLHVRVSGEAGAALGAIRRALASVDPEVPISEDRPLVEWLRDAFQPVRVAGTMLSAFGGLALVLSAIGLYGVLAVGVGLRRREIAIRRALGAERGAVAALVVKHGLVLAASGLAAGLAAAVVASRLFTSLLYDVGRYDPVAWVGAPAVLLVVAAAASYLPARRAVRIDPAATLRGE